MTAAQPGPGAPAAGPGRRTAELEQLARDILARYLEVIGGDRPDDVAEEIKLWEDILKGSPS